MTETNRNCMVVVDYKDSQRENLEILDYGLTREEAEQVRKENMEDENINSILIWERK